MNREVPEYWSSPKRTEEMIQLRHMVEENLGPLDRAKHFWEQGGAVIEEQMVTGHNGDAPTVRPYHWICAIDQKSGAAIDPPTITRRDNPVHFVHHDNRVHGAVAEHPLVADVNDWALPAWINDRNEALAEAKSANETPVYQPDAVQASR